LEKQTEEKMENTTQKNNYNNNKKIIKRMKNLTLVTEERICA
jgi:hypothetical protein